MGEHRWLGYGAIFLTGCSAPAPAPKTASDSSDEQYDSSADTPPLTAPYDYGAPPQPTMGGARQEDKWWQAAGACPEGSVLYGGAPPEHDRVGCKTPQGKNTGRFTRFFPSGVKLEEGAHEDHFATGTWTTWNESANKSAETPYVHGKKQGLETVWYPGGKLKSQRPYVDGVRHGVVFIWDEQERKRTALTYQAGKKHGREARWSSEGELVKVIDWNQDAIEP